MSNKMTDFGLIIASLVIGAGMIFSAGKDIPGWIQDHISQSQSFINQANTGYHELEGQPDPEQLSLEGKKKGIDGKAYWDGYRYGGTKDGKDICIKIK